MRLGQTNSKPAPLTRADIGTITPKRARCADCVNYRRHAKADELAETIGDFISDWDSQPLEMGACMAAPATDPVRRKFDTHKPVWSDGSNYWFDTGRETCAKFWNASIVRRLRT